MSKYAINKFFVYRHRIFIGYGLVAIGLIAALIFAGLYLPGGLSRGEIQSVITSDSIDLSDLNSWSLINLPYHILQKASLTLFGMSVLSIKLPSIILAFFSAVGMVILLRRWFKPSIGVLASLVAITTSQFLFLAQDGTPSILYIFWPIWLLVIASKIITQRKYRIYYVVAFYIIAALGLYTPLSIYALIALIGAIVLHPHLRYHIRRIPKPKIIIGIICAVALVLPLAMTLINSPSLGLSLLGIPSQWPNLAGNTSILGSQYLGFAKPGGTTLMTPLFELGSMMLIGIGIYHTIRTRHSSKSYVIILWTLSIIPFIVLNPSINAVALVPLVLLLATGLATLLNHWYGLFPLNPYARIGGLIPLVILVTVLVFSGAERYIYGYRYDPDIAPNFSQDIKLLPDTPVTVLVAENEQKFYTVLAKYHTNLTVVTQPTGDAFYSTRAAKSTFAEYYIDRIITVPHYDSGDRFYIYKKTAV